MTDEAETTTVDMDAVIAKIQKLISLTKGTHSEAEADTAMRRAQELMMKHGLDMAALEAADPSKKDTVERVKETQRARVKYHWQRQLAKYVAEAHFCYHLIRTQWVDAVWGSEGQWDYDKSRGYKPGHYEKSHVFVGRKGYVITAQAMFWYLTQTIEDNVPIKDNHQRLSNAAFSWKEGCADRLCERLSERRKDLIEKNDAAAKAAHADNLAEFKRRQAEKEAATPKQLPAHRPSEVAAAFAGVGAGARNAVRPAPEGDEEPERPEIDPDDTWTPQGEQPEEEPDPGHAMVLASVFDDAERDANYEKAYGLEPGYLARRRAQEAAEEAEWERRQAEEAAKEEVDEIEKPVREETERQRKAREKREAEEWARQRRRWARESAAEQRKAAREWAKRDHKMYRAGAEKGKSIGLDAQISSKSHEPKKLK